MAVRGINKVILVGRLGKDPEVRYIPNGGAVANLQVATSESWRFWQVITEAGMAAREASHAVREMERWMVPNKLREAA